MDNWIKAAIAEFIGTFTLIFIGAGSVIVAGSGAPLVGIALAHGLAIALMISALGHISGGHFNPAVTFGFLVTRRIQPELFVVYVITQLLGAVVGGLLLLATFPARAAAAAGGGVPNLSGIDPVAGIIIEAVMTFLLVTSVFGTAVDPRGPKSIAGFGIGLTMAMDILAGGPLTGGAMNPARTFGPAVAFGVWANHFVYWVGPLIGGGLAALLYHYVLMPGQPEKQ